MRRLIALLLFACACGPSAGRESPSVDGGDGRFDGGGGDGETFAVTGTVWAPGQAPGMVPSGHEIPVSGALVYLTQSPPAAPEQGATCTPCTLSPANGVITDAKGNFQLVAFPGTWWLVVEKADFRRQQQVTVSGPLALTAEQTTLPSKTNPTAGTFAPRIALATGYSGDPMEDVLGKMGFGEVDEDGTFVPSSAAGVFDIYDNVRDLGLDLPGVSELVGDLDTMLQYDIIFLPCDFMGSGDSLPKQENVRKNLRDYVRMGGRLYVADWAGNWVDNVFPTQLELQPGPSQEEGYIDTPSAAYDAATDTWDTGKFGTSNGSPAYTSTASSGDEGLSQWLEGQVAPGPDDDGETGATISAESFPVIGLYNRIAATHQVEVGNDDMGQPVIDSPKVYVSGTSENSGEPSWDDEIKPLLATYEPAGCGRVMYSTFHTAGTAHVGLLPQERVLLYLLLEIGVCKDDVVVD